ncbi:3180_t:CDS:2, partial [Funneliformis mosseae]
VVEVVTLSSLKSCESNNGFLSLLTHEQYNAPLLSGISQSPHSPLSEIASFNLNDEKSDSS